MSGITNLKLLRDEIEKMDSIHQIHIFKILKENQIDFTENSNGVFINMTLLDDSTLKQINNFIKAQYQKEFYKDNKEKPFG